MSISAAPLAFERKGAKISVDMPDYIALPRAGDDRCVFWRKIDDSDCCGFYFGGALCVGKNDKKDI